MTTATLPIPALTPAPGPAAQGGPAAAGKGPSFSQVLARQQGGKPGEAGTPAAPGGQAGAPAQGPATQNPAGAGKPGNPGDTAALPVDGQQEPAAETAADAATLAALAAQAAPAPALPLQALEIAAEAAAVNAQVAAATQAAGAAARQPAHAALLAGQPATPAAPAAAGATLPIPRRPCRQPCRKPRNRPLQARSPWPPARPTRRPPKPPQRRPPRPACRTRCRRPAARRKTAARRPSPCHRAGPAATAGRGRTRRGPARGGPGAHCGAPGRRQPGPASLPAAAQPLGLEVASPVGSSQWGQELGRQLVTISHDARQGHHTAELRLDPPDLGPCGSASTCTKAWPAPRSSPSTRRCARCEDSIGCMHGSSEPDLRNWKSPPPVHSRSPAG
nr:flagellar hook-length control protein FliK [Bordetella pertussis]